MRVKYREILKKNQNGKESLANEQKMDNNWFVLER